MEACVTSRYRDQAGVWTVGFGHTKAAGHPDPETIREPITVNACAVIFERDLEKYEDAVSALVTVDLKQNQYDALVSFTFNVGIGAFQRSTLRRKLNAGDLKGAAKEFPRWNRVTIGGKKIVSDGLVKRREKEAQIFAFADYPDDYGIVYPARNGRVQWGDASRVDFGPLFSGLPEDDIKPASWMAMIFAVLKRLIGKGKSNEHTAGKENDHPVPPLRDREHH